MLSILSQIWSDAMVHILDHLRRLGLWELLLLPLLGLAYLYFFPGRADVTDETYLWLVAGAAPVATWALLLSGWHIVRAPFRIRDKRIAKLTDLNSQLRSLLLAYGRPRLISVAPKIDLPDIDEPRNEEQLSKHKIVGFCRNSLIPLIISHKDVAGRIISSIDRKGSWYNGYAIQSLSGQFLDYDPQIVTLSRDSSHINKYTLIEMERMLLDAKMYCHDICSFIVSACANTDVAQIVDDLNFDKVRACHAALIRDWTSLSGDPYLGKAYAWIGTSKESWGDLYFNRIQKNIK